MKKHLEYPECSVYDHISRKAKEYGSLCALDYFGRSISYRELMREINQCACALVAAGVKKGDSISICLPNIPQAVYQEMGVSSEYQGIPCCVACFERL